MAAQKASDEQIVTALIACGGVMTHTAERLGIALSSLKDRVTVNQDLINARDEGRQAVLDAAESELFKAARAGKPWAVRFVLGRLGRGRGYGASLELEGSGTGRVVVFLPDDGREGVPDGDSSGDDGDQAASGAANDSAAEQG